MFLVFFWDQRYIIFLFLYILFAIHHSLRHRHITSYSHKIHVLPILIFFVSRFHWNIDCHEKYLVPISNDGVNFHIDLIKGRLLKSCLRMLGMPKKKLYRDTLRSTLLAPVIQRLGNTIQWIIVNKTSHTIQWIALSTFRSTGAWTVTVLFKCLLKWMTDTALIVCVTKFSIVIGSPRAY